MKTAKKMKLRKDDEVKVISGRERGKTGRILKVDAEKETVLIEGVNMVKKAMKKRKQQDKGGILEVESPIHISNVMYLTKSGKASKIGFRYDGDNKVRYAKKTGEALS